MGRDWLMPAAAAGAALIALAACSGSEGPDAVDPPGDSTVEATTTAEVVLPATAATAEALEPVVEETATTEEEYRASLRERWRKGVAEDYEQRLRQESLLATSVSTTTLPPLPTWEFPDDLALLILHYRVEQKDGIGEMFLQRIYWSGGELVRETVFSYDPVAGGWYNFGLVAAPDASSLIHTVCDVPSCGLYPYLVDDELPPLGRSALNESRDGGVTWEQLVEFDAPDFVEQVLPGGNGDDRLVLVRPYRLPDLILWPSGETVREPEAPHGYEQQHPRSRVILDDAQLAWAFRRYSSFNEHDPRLGLPSLLYLTADGEDVTELVMEQPRPCDGPQCLTLPDGRLLEGLVIIDPETGERGAIELPSADVPRAEDGRLFLAVQQGPFLRVVDVGDCLPVLADRSLDAEELACAAERVLLQDQGGDVITDDGTTWHRVRTPSGVVGWADGRWLE